MIAVADVMIERDLEREPRRPVSRNDAGLYAPVPAIPEHELEPLAPLPSALGDPVTYAHELLAHFGDAGIKIPTTAEVLFSLESLAPEAAIDTPRAHVWRERLASAYEAVRQEYLAIPPPHVWALDPRRRCMPDLASPRWRRQALAAQDAASFARAHKASREVIEDAARAAAEACR